MNRELDMQQLRTFMALAQALSYTKAAEKIHRTQSAVSHAIRKLEDSAGVKLVNTHGRRIKLTDHGRCLYEACQTAFNELDKAIEVIASSRGQSLGQIKLGARVQFGNNVLLKHMKQFLDAHPQIEVSFYMSDQLIEPLLRDELDIIIDCQEHQHPDLKRDILFREKYDVACSPLYQKQHHIERYDDLSHCAIISLDRQANWWHRFLLSIPQIQRPNFGKLIDINHIRGAIVAAISSLGVILVPRYSIIGEIQNGQLLTLFPELKIQEDRFSIYQKRTKSTLSRLSLLTRYLKSIHPAELGV